MKKDVQITIDETGEVSYSLEVNGGFLEITGELITVGEERNERTSFEPSYFNSDEAEEYYYDNAEEIEEAVIDYQDNKEAAIGVQYDKLKRVWFAFKGETTEKNLYNVERLEIEHADFEEAKNLLFKSPYYTGNEKLFI